MSLISDLVPLLKELPECCIVPIANLVRGAVASDDPARFIERRLVADTAHAASQAAVQAALHNDTE
jgi:hypothetical protein